MRDRVQTYAPYAVFAVSGAAGLALEVLWLDRLAVLFGNTAYAAATTLAVFFLGLAAGAHVWGRRAHATRRPLRTYAALELGVAASALLCLGLLAVFRRVYAPLFAAIGDGPWFPVAKLVLAAAALLPPAFFMGGTLPALAQHTVQSPARVGEQGSALYAVNTIGAAAGAFLAGFSLRPALGLTGAYLVAVGLTLLAALGALAIDAGGASARVLAPSAPPSAARGAARPAPALTERAGGGPSQLGGRLVAFLAFFSGFGTLALEVLWTRLLAQVLNNSVYAFTAIIVTFLAALAAGAATVSVAVRWRRSEAILPLALGAAGASTLLAAQAFVRLTRGLSYIVEGASWVSYVGTTFVAAAVLMLVPAAFAGGVLPSLFHSMRGSDPSAGRVLGRLVAINALGSVAGALGAGFVLLDALGLWRATWLVAAGYAALAALVAVRLRAAWPVRSIVLAAVTFVAAVGWTVGSLPVARLARTEQVVQVWEGSGGTVAVVRDGEGLSMRLNNHYVLGDSRTVLVERMQAHLPLLLHPSPRSVFLLGLGTGATAGAALDHPVERVLVTELVPDVVTASRTHFVPVVNGLFDDSRAQIVVEDGRAYLAGTGERFDVIIGDLFTPWHAGTGSLYTREHFQSVRARLRPGGLFAQWLPLYQMSGREFLIVARTLRSVFPQVTLWRGDFSSTRPVVALVAWDDTLQLDHAALLRNVTRIAEHLPGDATGKAHMTGLFYGGNMSGLASVLDTMPINTDDLPVIEYGAPKSIGDSAARLTGLRLAGLYDALLGGTPPDRDPLLRELPERELSFVAAGLAFYKYHAFQSIAKRAGLTPLSVRAVTRCVATARNWIVPATGRPCTNWPSPGIAALIHAREATGDGTTGLDSLGRPISDMRDHPRKAKAGPRRESPKPRKAGHRREPETTEQLKKHEAEPATPAPTTRTTHTPESH